MKKLLSLTIISALAFTMTFSCAGIANAISTVDAPVFDYDMSLENGIEVPEFNHDVATEDSIDEEQAKILIASEDINPSKATDPRVMSLKEIKKALKDGNIKVTAKIVKVKSGKPAVELSFNANDLAVKLTGIKVYRSTKKNSGYGKTALKTTKNSSYINTNVKSGNKYYYKVKGYVIVDGKKYYTDYSEKTSITVSKKKMTKYTKPVALYSNQPSLAGGYMAAEDTTVTEELKSMFDKATDNLDGVAYEPIKLMGTQVVAGLNYKFLCKAKGVFPGATETKKIVTIYKDLEGNCTVTDIADYE